MFRMKFGSRINAFQAGAILEYQNTAVVRNTVLLGIAAELNISRRESRALDLYLQNNKSFQVHSIGDSRKTFPVETWLCSEPYGLVNEDGVLLVVCTQNELTKNDYARIQLDLYCADRDWCDCIFYWLDNDGAEQLKINRFERDQHWLLSNLPKLKKSWEQAVALNQDDMRNYHDNPDITERTDDEWLMYSNIYKDICENLEHYKLEQKWAKSMLMSLADYKPATGNGVSLAITANDNLSKYNELMNLMCQSLDILHWTSLTVQKIVIEVNGNSNSSA